MRVNFYATLRQIVGGESVEFPIDTGTSVNRLLSVILSRYPEMEKELLDEQGKLYGHVHIFINGRDVQFLADSMDSKISINDRIDIFPAVGGGG
jgi:molybdopterin synthase sulfur carrier subunit